MGMDRAERKRRTILGAAREVFLEHGYVGASMDQVAALAAVSKQTVYQHFTDKRGLFAAVITADVRAAEQRSDELLDALAGTADPEADLRAVARGLVTVVTQPHLVRMRRVVIGEAERFPDLAALWYATGPERGYHRLAERFARLADRGLLRVPDPLAAARHFTWLVLSVPLNQAMFDPAARPTEEELLRVADDGVRVFLAAYAA
ncbi:TetR/AcrR family transcriptional regulator [Saccharothrix syringae]|uniref:TetR family transcriptional regulator n=1 Tax=Saccharothrix syringae TaxID=103733 RepID=A0A5Q0GZD3_SACSY|nr:TetR/AcrR family transcriptional regulator [Saccharothrix syringae]QFZ19298.1 TetR family transcriptional regulator [Saccharothrix syringae]